MTLSSRLSVNFNTQLSAPVDLGKQSANLSKDVLVNLADGTLVGQANRVYADTLSIAASGTSDVDLAGALLDALGGPAVFARVKALLISAAPGNTNDVVVGAASANAWAALLGATGTVRLRPGATAAFIAGGADLNGYAVTSGTGDVLRLANGAAGTAVSLDIVIIGASA